jgi:hypothetical protein
MMIYLSPLTVAKKKKFHKIGTWPVMNDAEADAKKTIVDATSSQYYKTFFI